ncbi:MAG: ribonuclease P protein component [Fusobacteriota bacterium]
MISIKKNREFQKIYNYGKKYFGKYLLIIILPNNLNYNRLGVVASKKTGNAVVRNKIKRIFREIFRLNINKISGNYDIVIISKYHTGNKIKSLDYKKIESDFLRVLKKAKVLK